MAMPKDFEDMEMTELKMAVPQPSGQSFVSGSKVQIDRKNETEADALSVAKDRGQVTMTSAMSIANITLLKAELDRGPNDNPFFVPVVVLNCLALSLQVLAGVLSLCISQMRSYYDKFTTPKMRCCPLSVHCISRDTAAGDCCPCEMIPRFYKDSELDLIYAWQDWVIEDTQQDMRAAEAKIMIGNLNHLIDSCQRELKTIKEDGKRDGDRAKTSAKIEEYVRLRERYENCRNWAEVSNAKGDVLSAAMHDITRNHALKRAQTWQYIINMMLYCSFIINIFLTGFGLAS